MARIARQSPSASAPSSSRPSASREKGRLRHLLPSWMGGKRTSQAAQARRKRLRGLVENMAHGQTGPKWPTPERFALGLATIVVLSALLCVHLLPNRVALREGDVADRDVIAPRTVRYEDTEATKRLKSDAARQVEIVYQSIPGATATATDAVYAAFDQIQNNAPRTVRLPPAPVRPNPIRPKQQNGVKPASPTPTVRATPTPTVDSAARLELARTVAREIQDQARLTLTTDTISTLLEQKSAVRSTARDTAVRLVTRAMSRAITENTRELADAREDVSRSPLLLRLPSQSVREAVAKVVQSALTPTRRIDQRATEKQIRVAESAISPQMRRLPAGTPVIRKGEPVTQQHLDAFTALGLQNAHLDAASVSTVTLLVCLLFGLAVFYIRQFHPELYCDTSRLLLLSLLTVISVLGLKVGSALLGVSVPGVPFVYLGMMCVASAGMVIALLLSPRVALLIVALLSVASGLVLNNELRYTLITLGSSLGGIVAVTSLRNRNDLLRATLVVCGVNAFLNILAGQLDGELLRELPLGVMWGVISGVFAVALFYFGVAAFEKPFGITTHLRLLELSDPAAPVLQEFRMRVPGTYAHSLMVSNLAHAAAETIGADALLVRVAAYYHDLGKMNRPEFFIENQSGGDNVHDRLAPSLSAIILVSHVKEGVEMAQELGLPPRVIEIIQQHHGTTLMKYFYHRATGGSGDPQLEAQFRYPGPKPQTREAAILMLADSVEAASRTLTRPTPQRVAEFVSEIVSDKQSDGQLDECDLTLRDLTVIQAVFTRTLSAALHARIEYPAAKKTAPAQPSAERERPQAKPRIEPTSQPLTEPGLTNLSLSLTGPVALPSPPPGPLSYLEEGVRVEQANALVSELNTDDSDFDLPAPTPGDTLGLATAFYSHGDNASNSAASVPSDHPARRARPRRNAKPPRRGG